VGTGAQFSRLKVWGRERLLFADLNGEFNNILNNLNAAGIGGSSPTLAAFQASFNAAPIINGAVTPILPLSQNDENLAMRYVLQQLTGGPFWYSAPSRILSAQTADVVAHISFGPNVGQTPSAGTPTDAFADVIRRGAIINAASLSTADFSSAMMDAVNTLFGEYAYDLGPTHILAIPALAKLQGSVLAQFRNLANGDYIAYNPVLGIELFLDSNGFLNAKLTESTSANQTTAVGMKNVAQITGTVSRALDTAYQAAALSWSVANGPGGDSLNLYLAGTTEGSQIAAATIPISTAMIGGVWFFGCKHQDPAWNHLSVFAVLPDAEANDAWNSVNGTQSTISTPAGVMTIDAVGTTATTYTKNNNVDLTQQVVETKVQMPTQSGVSPANNSSVIAMAVSDAVANRSVVVTLISGAVQVTLGNNAPLTVAYIDTSIFHIYRLTSSGAGSPVTKLYIDGVIVWQATNTVAFNLGSTYVQFGTSNNGTAEDLTANFEWFGYFLGAVLGPVTGDTQGQLDDIAVVQTPLNPQIIASLVSNSIKVIYGTDFYQGITLPPNFDFVGTYNGVGEIVSSRMYVASDGISDIGLAIPGLLSAGSALAMGQAMMLDSAAILQSRGGVGATALSLALATRQKFPVGLRTLSFYNNVGPAGFININGTMSVSHG